MTIGVGTVIKNAIGGSGNDIITGNGEANILTGGNGNDSISGSSGNDTLNGGSGADILDGGTGSDSYRDLFDFNSITESKVGASYRDRVYNFKSGTDDIDLKTIDAIANFPGDQAFKFSNKTASAYSVWYVQANIDSDGLKDDIIVKGDINGNITADFEIGVVGVTSVAAGDFVM